MHYTYIVMNVTFGAWLLGADAYAGPFNFNAALPSVNQLQVNTSTYVSNNYNVDEERLPENIIKVMEKGIENKSIQDAIKEIRGGNYPLWEEFTYVKHVIDKFNEIFSDQHSTLIEVYKGHVTQNPPPTDSSTSIQGAKSYHTTENIGEELYWLIHEYKPSLVLEKLDLNKGSVLIDEKFTRLLNYIKAYNILFPYEPTTLYESMSRVFRESMMNDIILNGMKTYPCKSFYVAYQLKWMKHTVNPKQLLTELHAERILHYFISNVKKFNEELKKKFPTENISRHQGYVRRCFHHGELTIKSRIDKLNQYHWIKRNFKVTRELITWYLTYVESRYFNGKWMTSWIEYVDDYTIHMFVSQQTLPDLNADAFWRKANLLDWTTYDESDIITYLFMSVKADKASSRRRWLDDLQSRWLDKSIDPSAVFDRLQIKKDKDTIGISEFVEWLHYVKAYRAKRHDPSVDPILKYLVNLVKSQKLVNADEKPANRIQIDILLPELKKYITMKEPGKSSISQEQEEFLDKMIIALSAASDRTIISEKRTTDTNISKDQVGKRTSDTDVSKLQRRKRSKFIHDG